MTCDARQEAIDAMTLALCASDASAREIEAALDAIPASVLARLAVERGGLEQVPNVFIDANTDRSYTIQGYTAAGFTPTDRADEPVYRITEEAP